MVSYRKVKIKLLTMRNATLSDTQWVILLHDPDIAEFTQFSHEMNGETG